MSAVRVTSDFVGGPTGPGRAAPGLGGYVVAVVIADLVASLLVAVYLGVATGSPGFSLLAAVVVLVVVTVASAPVAVVALPVVHLLCRHSSRQGVHVAVAGAAGLATGVVVDATMLSRWPGPWIPASVVLTVACALGRAAVVREVRQAQQDFARRRPLG